VVRYRGRPVSGEGSGLNVAKGSGPGGNRTGSQERRRHAEGRGEGCRLLIPFKPDWVADGKTAPFKRNDRRLEIVPAGVIVVPGSGISSNLDDKAKRLGIPIFNHREGGA
jgi:hypothetical protein